MAPRKKYRRALVWMRRALRVHDNVPLWTAVQEADEVIPVICLRDEPKYSDDTPRRRFLRHVLSDLDHRLRDAGSLLLVREGTPEAEIPAVAVAFNAEAVYAAKVYDCPTQVRDHTITRALQATGKTMHLLKDVVIFEEREVLASGDNPYKVFTPYKRAWLERSGDIPRPLPAPPSIATPSLRGRGRVLAQVSGFAGVLHGRGESEARRRLNRFTAVGLGQYKEQRDLPGVDGTSKLSPALSIGALSPRTVYWKARDARDGAGRQERESIDVFISELIWREFYYAILANFPHVMQTSFKEEFQSLVWSENTRHFTAWCEGRTGYPIVDAAMRQLLAEGWMHNRTRMIAASFLTKDLHLNWQWGEKYFFERLMDADRASNNGGWQWTAGTGTDASPWFRIFNPTLQGERFDPEGNYVRRYLPELARIPSRMIHTPWKLNREEQQLYHCVIGRDYPPPLVDHSRERKVALELYKNPGRHGSTASLFSH